MGKNEKGFCCLCGKWREEKLTLIILGVIEEVNERIEVNVCKNCDVIVHNIKRLYNEKKQQALKKLIDAQPILNVTAEQIKREV